MHFVSYLAKFFLEREMFQTKVVGKFKTYILCTKTFFFFENRSFYEVMWKSIAEPCRLQMAIRRMRIACWIPRSTNTHLEYVILNAFPQQQWFARTRLTVKLYIRCLSG